MHYNIEPELTVPLYQGVTDPADVRAAAVAMFASSEFLSAFGADRTVTPGSRVVARAVMNESLPPQEVQDSPTAVHLKNLIDEYDRQVIQSAVQIRTYVTNRLIEEAAPGKRGAIRALELLGKIAGVDLFQERSEITIKTRPAEELQALVREKLSKLASRTNPATIEDATFTAVDGQNEGPARLEAEPVPVPDEDPFEAARGALNALTQRN